MNSGLCVLLLGTIAVGFFQSTAARVFLTLELDKADATADIAPRKLAQEATLGDIPIPRRPPGFSIGPSDAGLLRLHHI